MGINFFEMSVVEKDIIIDKIFALKKGIVLLDGPIGSGKTYLINMLTNKTITIQKLSGEEITEILLKKYKRQRMYQQR